MRWAVIAGMAWDAGRRWPVEGEALRCSDRCACVAFTDYVVATRRWNWAKSHEFDWAIWGWSRPQRERDAIVKDL
jgi:hypothetical protein